MKVMFKQKVSSLAFVNTTGQRTTIVGDQRQLHWPLRKQSTASHGNNDEYNWCQMLP